MKKSLLASVIGITLCAVSTPLLSAEVPGAAMADDGFSGAYADQALVDKLVSAGRESDQALRDTLETLSSEEDFVRLKQAKEYIFQTGTLPDSSVQLIDARIKALKVTLSEAGLIAINGNDLYVSPWLQGGALAGGLAIVALTADGSSESDSEKGGSGDGGDDPADPNPTPEPSPEPAPEPTPEPGPTPGAGLNAEMEFTSGYEITGTDAAHARGLSGEGVTIAIMDTGVRESHEELSGKIKGFYNPDLDSEDKSDVGDTVGHGTHVAGIIGAKRNDNKGVGFAYGADLLAIKHLRENGNSPENLLKSDANTAKGFKWAREKGADFINNSWGKVDVKVSDYSKELFEATYSATLSEMKTGVNSDIVYVWSAGNSGESQTNLTAGLPELFPELKAGWVAVTNIDEETGQLNDSSQACGNASDWCISAPGTLIGAPVNTGDSDYQFYTGTSMAAPIVSSALALVKEQFPMLTNQEVLERLFITADKSGIYANVNLYGQGLLDTDTATMPVGETSLVTRSGDQIFVKRTRLTLGSAFGTQNPLSGVKALSLDAQGAGFVTDLGQLGEESTFDRDLARAASYLGVDGLTRVKSSENVSLSFRNGGRESNEFATMILGFKAGDSQKTSLGWFQNTDDLNGELTLTGKTQTAVTYTAPYWMSEEDNKSSGLKHSMQMNGGDLSVMAMKSNDRFGASAAWKSSFSGYETTFEFGHVMGQDSLFGSESNGGLHLNDESKTRFMGFRGNMNIGNATLFHSAYFGETDVQVSGVIENLKGVKTSSWSFGSLYEHDDNNLGIVVAQPLKAESAEVKLGFVDGWKNGHYTTRQVNADLAPKGRQINTELFWGTKTRHIEDVRFSLLRIDNPGHNSNAEADYTIMMSLKSSF